MFHLPSPEYCTPVRRGREVEDVVTVALATWPPMFCIDGAPRWAVACGPEGAWIAVDERDVLHGLWWVCDQCRIDGRADDHLRFTSQAFQRKAIAELRRRSPSPLAFLRPVSDWD